MTPEQEISNLRRQAAEAFRQGDFSLMNQFDAQATAKKSQISNTLFAQMQQQAAQTMPKPVDVPDAVINQPSRRIFRVAAR